MTAAEEEERERRNRVLHLNLAASPYPPHSTTPCPGDLEFIPFSRSRKCLVASKPRSANVCNCLTRMRGDDQQRLDDQERPRSQGELPGSLVVQAPNFVTSIAVVSRLTTFFSSHPMLSPSVTGHGLHRLGLKSGFLLLSCCDIILFKIKVHNN